MTRKAQRACAAGGRHVPTDDRRNRTFPRNTVCPRCGGECHSCTHCGCTDCEGCAPAGCYWVDQAETVCSACAAIRLDEFMTTKSVRRGFVGNILLHTIDLSAALEGLGIERSEPNLDRLRSTLYSIARTRFRGDRVTFTNQWPRHKRAK